LPYTKDLNEKSLSLGYKHIFCHICGEQNMNLPYWAQNPFGDPGFISFGHQVDLETATEYFPNDIIVGNLEPAIIQTGTPKEVYEAARKVIEKGKRLPGALSLHLAVKCHL
jgi:uroporphyrinogen decarboxylase